MIATRAEMPEPKADARAEEAAKLAALRRTKTIATGALVLCVVVFLVARAAHEIHPAFQYVAAFAEAAAIGGLADWYAIVALFRRPLGLPIPHTAIIPANRNRIADNLGRFIEVNFLTPDPVRKKLEEIDFAGMVANWLSDSERSAELARFVGRLTPRALASVEGSGLRQFLSKRISDQIDKVEIAPFAADMLATITADRRHQRLFDQILRVFGGFLSDEDAQDALRDKIRQELPSLATLFRVDAYLLKKIIASAATLIDDVTDDHQHPLRREFDRFVDGFIADLRTSPAYADRAESLKRDLLTRPELIGLAGDVWTSLRDFVEQDLANEGSVVQRHLAEMFAEVGRHLAIDTRMQAEMNHGFVVALASFFESQKSGVSTFIAEQVRGWDIVQLTRLVELNIGRDLQYIRFNGMIIGGMAGLALHVSGRLFLGE